MFRYQVQQFKNIFTDQQLLAEGIEAFDFAATLIGFHGLVASAVGEFAGNDSGQKKCKKSHPVLRFCNRETENRRKKEIVVREGRDYRHEDRVTKAPSGRNHQGREQKRESHSGGINRQPLEINDDDPADCCDGNGKA